MHSNIYMSRENFSACGLQLDRCQLENINLIIQFMSNESIKLVIKWTGGLAHTSLILVPVRKSREFSDKIKPFEFQITLRCSKFIMRSNIYMSRENFSACRHALGRCQLENEPR